VATARVFDRMLEFPAGRIIGARKPRPSQTKAPMNDLGAHGAVRG
jgi:hypothetical protein